MKLSEVQSAALALLNGNADVAAFAPILVEDGVTDFEPMILAATQARGACLAIGDIALAERDNASTGRRVISQAALSVFLFELPTVQHMPSGLPLVERITRALIANEQFEFLGLDRFQNEKGGTLAVIDFTARVTIGA